MKGAIMYRFIYVFDEETANAMVEYGYSLIKVHDGEHVYVFENIPDTTFHFSEKNFVYSNTLTF